MHAFPYSRIVAIDLGKFNSVLCVFDPATGRSHLRRSIYQPSAGPLISSVPRRSREAD